MEAIEGVQALPLGTVIAVALGSILLFVFFKANANDRQRIRAPSNLHPVPEIPGLPVIGNLLQLKEKKPHKTFTKWAEIYGPIYSIRTGATKIVVLNSNAVAKEAMVTRYSSISSRKLTNALTLLTRDKTMIAMSDYNDFYKTAKRHVLISVLGTNAQKRHRTNRDFLTKNTVEKVQMFSRIHANKVVDFGKIFRLELFAMAMKQAFGENVESIYVEELGTNFSSEQILKVLVFDQMEGALEVDWRELFPYFKWVPNRTFEAKVQRVYDRTHAVMKSLIKEQKKRFDSGEVLNCYLDHLLAEAKSFTEEQISMLLWESMIQSSDTVAVTVEWAMYEIAKNPNKQDRLYRDILNVCGANKVTEEDLSQLPYLCAIFHETLRRYSPVPLVPSRYVHEDTQLGGYYLPAGTEVAINIYGCNMDKKEWESPEEWKPERFLDGKYEGMDLYKTLAFGGGKRACIGAPSALLMSCMTIASLVQEFEWRLAEGEEDNVDTGGFTSPKLHPLRAVVKPRN